MVSPKLTPFQNELLEETRWVDQQIGRHRRIIDISNELVTADFKLPLIPRLPRQHGHRTAEQLIPPHPGMSAETKSRLAPYTPDIYKRLGKKESAQQIADDLASALNLPVDQVIWYIDLLRMELVVAAFDVMTEDIPKKIATEIITKFLMEGKPLDSESEQRMEVTWASYEDTDISREQQEKCQRFMGKIRRHLYLLEGVNVRSGLLSSQPADCERRGLYVGQLLVGLAKAALIVGYDYEYMIMEKGDWDSVVSLLGVACDPTFQYVSNLIAGCLKSGSVNEEDARAIGGNSGALARLYAVECFLTGLAVHTDPSYSIA